MSKLDEMLVFKDMLAALSANELEAFVSKVGIDISCDKGLRQLANEYDETMLRILIIQVKALERLRQERQYPE